MNTGNFTRDYKILPPSEQWEPIAEQRKLNQKALVKHARKDSKEREKKLGKVEAERVQAYIVEGFSNLQRTYIVERCDRRKSYKQVKRWAKSYGYVCHRVKATRYRDDIGHDVCVHPKAFRCDYCPLGKERVGMWMGAGVAFLLPAVIVSAVLNSATFLTAFYGLYIGGYTLARINFNRRKARF